MKVTLRKAAQLSTEVYKLISVQAAKVQTSTAVKVKPVRANNINVIYNESLNNLYKEVAKLRKLHSVYMELRVQIGVGNSKEVTPLLSQIAVVDMELKTQTQLLNSISVNPDSGAVVAQDFERACVMYETPSVVNESYYGRGVDSDFRLNVVEKDFQLMIERDIADLKKQKTILSDRLMEVNIITEIELSDFTEEILKEFRII